MAAKRRVQPKKSLANKRPTRAARRNPRAGSAPLVTRPRVELSEQEQIDPHLVDVLLIDAAEGRVLLDSRKGNVPRETFSPIPLTELPPRPRYWLGALVAGVIGLSIVLLALSTGGSHG